MKDPDGCFDCMRQAAKDTLPEGLSDDEREMLTEERQSAIQKLCSKWFRYGEYLTVEIDPETETITVLPAR